MLHKEVHQGPGYCGRGVKKESRDPEDGSLQLLQVQEEIIPVLDGQQVVVVSLKDAGVKCSQVGLFSHIFGVDICRSEVAAEDKVCLIDFRTAVASSQDAAVSHHSTCTVVFVKDGRCLGE